MKFHEAANEFPMLDAKRLQELAEDIGAQGLREPIMVADGKILDGRNRFKACELASVEPEYTEFNGGDPFAYVWSLNGERRDLTQDQRYLIWDSVNAKSEAWKKKQKKIQADANRKRSEAAKAGKVGRAAAKSKQGIQECSECGQSYDADKWDNSQGYECPYCFKFSGGTGCATTKVHRTREAKAKASKTNRGTVERMDKLKRDRPDLADKVKTGQMPGTRAVALANREKKTATLSEAAPLKGQFSVVYADPPWRYEHVKTHSRAIENQYPTMDLQAIRDLDVPTTDDAILFMWATAPKLEEALSVVQAWGFTYRTCAIWDKKKIGMGYYFRVQHELLLVATKGSPPMPPEEKRPSSMIVDERGKHSAKPASVYEIIEGMYPTLSKVELFARRARKGWKAWGNESGDA